MQVPFSILPLETEKRVAQLFLPMGARLKKFFPDLELQLKQADIEMNVREYLAIMFFLVVFYLGFFSFLFSLILTRFTDKFWILGPTMGLILGFLVLLQVSMYPTMQIRKKQKEIEKNLLFALRTMLIEIKSGVTLFDALQLISRTEYGKLSEEFKKAVDAINTGEMYEDALQRLATNNPSPYFRKAVWQIVNGMKAGGDIADVIRETVKSAARDQRIAINKYSANLRVSSLMYLMIGVIGPAMLMTVLIIIGSAFLQIQLGESIYWILLAAIIMMQLMYVGMLKSQRPTIIQ